MPGHKREAVENHKKFFGRAVERETRIEFTMPKALTLLGEGAAIEYRSDKELKQRGRTALRKKRLYRHVFGPGVRIYLHPNRRWILISGGNFRVTDWMRD